MTNFVIEFDYNIKQLNTIKNELLAIDITDIPQVENAVKKLVKIRRQIQEKGKTYRDEANAFNKNVLSKEKEYVSIIEPIENEYKEILVKEEERKVLEKRKTLLPMKMQQLSLLKTLQPTEEEVLNMSEEQWIVFYNQKVSEHERQIAFEAEQEKQEAERKAREEQIKKEAEEKAKREQEEALKKAEQDKIKAVEEAKKEAELKALREKQEVENKIRAEKEAEEARIKAEQESKAKMEADKKYQDFLKDNNYNESIDKIESLGGEVKLYRLVATFKK